MNTIEGGSVSQTGDQTATSAQSPNAVSREEIDSLPIYLQFLLPTNLRIPPEFEESVKGLQCRVWVSPDSDSSLKLFGIGGLTFDSVSRSVIMFLHYVVFADCTKTTVTVLFPNEFVVSPSIFAAKVSFCRRDGSEQLVVIEGSFNDVNTVCNVLIREAALLRRKIESLDHETYQLLRRYNALFWEFLTHFTQEEVVKRISDDVRTIQVELSQKKNLSLKDIADLDPTDPSNAVAVFVYIATTVSWNQCIANLSEGNVSAYGSGDTFTQFCTNLETLNSQRTEHILLSTDIPLLNRILLYSVIANFYMRAEEACYILPLSYYIDYQASAPVPIPDANWEFFYNISNTQVISSAFLNIDNEAPWSEVLSTLRTHVFAADLQKLHGISCFESYIFVDKQHIANIPEFIIVLLHELAHSGKRYPKRLDYFKSSPHRYLDEEHLVSIQEDGDYMEKLVFGGKVGSLYPGANEFLRTQENWRLGPAIFSQEVRRLQEEGTKKGHPIANLLMPRHIQRVCGWSFK